jgi:hypothetical protein
MSSNKKRRGVLAFLLAGIVTALLIASAFSVGWVSNAAPDPVAQPAVTVLTTTKPVPTTVVKSVSVPTTVVRTQVQTQTVTQVSQYCTQAIADADNIQAEWLQVATDMGNATSDMVYGGANAASNSEVESATALLKKLNDTDIPQYTADKIKCRAGE